jgi:hypothetical protein
MEKRRKRFKLLISIKKINNETSYKWNSSVEICVGSDTVIDDS